MDHLQKTPLISYKENLCVVSDYAVSYFPSAVPRQVDTDTNTANETANSKYSKYEILNLIQTHLNIQSLDSILCNIYIT